MQPKAAEGVTPYLSAKGFAPPWVPTSVDDPGPTQEQVRWFLRSESSSERKDIIQGKLNAWEAVHFILERGLKWEFDESTVLGDSEERESRRT